MAVLSLCLFSSLTLYASGKQSVKAEMERLGFGELTIWVNGDRKSLAEEIETIPDVEQVTYQPLIFSGYEVNGIYSDNEGQLLYLDGSVPYCLTDESGNVLSGRESGISEGYVSEQSASGRSESGDFTLEIASGTVYISPAMKSAFDVEIGIAYSLSYPARTAFTA